MLNYLWFIYTIGKPGGTIFIYIILTDTYRSASVFVYVYVYPPWYLHKLQCIQLKQTWTYANFQKTLFSEFLTDYQFLQCFETPPSNLMSISVNTTIWNCPCKFVGLLVMPNFMGLRSDGNHWNTRRLTISRQYVLIRPFSGCCCSVHCWRSSVSALSLTGL